MLKLKSFYLILTLMLNMLLASCGGIEIPSLISSNNNTLENTQSSLTSIDNSSTNQEEPASSESPITSSSSNLSSSSSTTSTSQQSSTSSSNSSSQTSSTNSNVNSSLPETNETNFIDITTAQELSNIRNNLFGNYRLLNDIDLEGVEWQPIGGEITSFSGVLEGNGFTIKNLTITQTQAYVGLFATNSGTIKNLKLDNVEINISGRTLAGSLVAENRGFVENITTMSGSIYVRSSGGIWEGNTGTVGGILGTHFGNEITFDRFTNNISVSGDKIGWMGGFVGSTNSNITITNSTNNGAVMGQESVGGFLGYGPNNIYVLDSVNNGEVVGTSDSVGGLVGKSFFYQTSTISITNSINNGTIIGNRFVGGLIGNGGANTALINSITIRNSMNSGSVSGIHYISGFIGYGRSTTIENSINIGSVSGYANCGGLVGYGWSTTITNSINIGRVNGLTKCGGLVGHAENQLFVYSSVNVGNVVITNGTSEVGGVAGLINGTNEFDDAYHYGSITNDGVEVSGNSFGSKVTEISTFNLAFFTTTLGWDTEVWDFTGLDIANGVYPKLKDLPSIET